MTAPRQPQPDHGQVPAVTQQHGKVADNVADRMADRQEEELDEALDESFPASDPVAVSITVIDVPAPPR